MLVRVSLAIASAFSFRPLGRVPNMRGTLDTQQSAFYLQPSHWLCRLHLQCLPPPPLSLDQLLQNRIHRLRNLARCLLFLLRTRILCHRVYLAKLIGRHLSLRVLPSGSRSNLHPVAEKSEGRFLTRRRPTGCLRLWRTGERGFGLRKLTLHLFKIRNVDKKGRPPAASMGLSVIDRFWHLSDVLEDRCVKIVPFYFRCKV